MKYEISGDKKQVTAIVRTITNMCKNLGVELKEVKETKSKKTPKNETTQKEEVKESKEGSTQY